MKEILEECYTYRRIINIRQNKPVLEYLKGLSYNHKFILQRVNTEEYKILKENNKDFIKLNDRNYIAGYAPLKGNSFRGSGGLKISDPEEKIRGSFVIEDKRIIYNPEEAFYKERDSYVYFGNTFYTTMSMNDIFIELLKRKREYLVYMGQELNLLEARDIEILETIDKEMLIEYATIPEKGEQAYLNKIHRIVRKK